KCLAVVSTLLRSSACTPKLPSISTGRKTRLTTNALVRTAALYSRRAMITILRSIGGGLRLGPGDADEDVVQRRPGDLEVAYGGPRHERGQHLLRVGAGGQAQLVQPAELGDVGHARHGPRVEAVALQPHADGVASVAVLDRLQGAVEDLAALV